MILPRSGWCVPVRKPLQEQSRLCRRWWDEFATLARFPVAKPQPADINDVIENALSMFKAA